MYIDTLKQIAAKFEILRTFTAVKRVYSEAIGLPSDRILCQAGNKITVVKWHCVGGPTNILVNDFKNHCIPFEWVKEMGAPKDLYAYMPFAPKTWDEVIKEEENRLANPLKTTSSLAPACAGCQWISSDPDQWCEMFRNTPEELPCSQHDSFKPIREAMVKSGMAKLVVASAAIAAPLSK